jgi:hypothetical protein
MIKAILIDLRENLNDLDYPFLLRASPRDIRLLKKIENLLVRHFRRPWVYMGAEKPYPPKQELVDEIDRIDASDQEKERLKEIVTEKELPLELETVLEGGDAEEFHNHSCDIRIGQQMEEYLIPENRELVVDIIHGDTHRLNIRGPSILIVGKADHRRESGECFVVKFPSGNFKNISKK